MHSAPAIKADHLSLRREGEWILRNVSFTVPTGSYVAVIGPNGGGKTTLMRLLLGLTSPTLGSVQVGEQRGERARVAYVPQRGGLLDAHVPATVEEVVQSGRTTLRPFRTRADKRAVAHVLHVMRIGALRQRGLSTLSGGERQRVLLARALVNDPEILVLDEPMDGLDPASREETYALLRRLHREGMTIVFVSHDVHRLAREASMALCLRHDLVCHGEHVCVLEKNQLHVLVHDHEELANHHA